MRYEIESEIMFSVARSNLYLNCLKVSPLSRKVRISYLDICKCAVRFNANNESANFNKQISANDKPVQTFREDIPSQKIGIAEQLVLKCPANTQPYLKLARLHKPIGTWLLFWPCSWSISMVAQPGCWPDLHLLALFGLGSVIMRGAGCTINDMWDRDIDRKVARTKTRPLVDGSLNLREATVFLACQLGLGLLVLLQLNWYSVLLGASSLALVSMYPLAKRFTHWPQIVLGMTFNWGILLGFSAVQGYLNLVQCLPLYVAAVCWTMIYDTIYAHQDIKDDLLIGVMVGSLTTAGVMLDQTTPYYAAVALVTSHLAWQIYSLNIQNPADCSKKFISNTHVGLILLAGIVLGNLGKKPAVAPYAS